MSVPASVLLIAILIGVGALAKPLAERMRVPLAIVHAALGIGLGAVCLVAVRHPGLALPPDLAAFVSDLPVGSALFLYGFLPALLFQSALSVDVQRIREDILPIAMLAVIAVVLVTLGIGLALWPVAGLPLAACLLVASILATTDPVAVIAIFRSAGAPDHLVRLVEGESLFNDAVAIALFVTFTALIVTPDRVTAATVLLDFAILPAGGAVIGTVMAWCTVAAMRLLPGDRVGAASLSLVLPYLVFLAAEELGVSGVIAVVAAGVTLATLAPGRLAGETWRYMQDVWVLLADSIAILVFILTSILVPRLLTDAGWHDLGLIAIAFLVALAVRAVVLLVLIPALARFGRSLDIPRSYRLVALWGGLRGSMTLVLAMAVTENPGVPREVAAFVATVAAGFTLMTLFVHGGTLRPLMQWLRLDTLGEVDRVVRDLALAASATRVARAVGRAPEGDADPKPPAALDREAAVAIALVAATAREREAVLDHFDSGTVPPHVARVLVAAARRRLDLSRTAGAEGYARADAEEASFGWPDRLAVAVQQRTGSSAMLAARLEIRYQALLESGLIVRELPEFVARELAPVLGDDAAAAVTRLLSDRLAGIEREIAALRLQYPSYAAAVGQAMAGRAATALETAEVARMRRVGIIGGDVERALRTDIAGRAAVHARVPRLDLGLDARRLIDACALFATLTGAERDALAPQLAPFFAPPGMRIVRRGERGEAAYFISSGAVEVDTGHALRRLGSGDAFGEMALIYDIPRQADVTAIAYSNLLRLSAPDFRAFLDRHPDLRERLNRLADSRRDENLGQVGAVGG